jgi:tRNA pseudouridine38-40 synthase
MLEYDGSGFAGWQVQQGGRPTVQGCLEDAVAQVTGRRVRVEGSGRTDAGVHAEAQVASLQLESPFDAPRLKRALNGVLPDGVVVVAAEVASDGFHARRDAVGKRYVYRVWNGQCRSPLRAHRSHWLAPALDLGPMQRAARDFVGRHDFAALQAAGSDIEKTVRRLGRLDIVGESRGEIEIVVEADGFLHHMVRNLAGTLLEVGLGRRAPDSIPALLASRDRRQAGPTAPAQGLTLVCVWY